MREAIRASRKRLLGAGSNLLVLLFATFGQLGALRLLVRQKLAYQHPGRAETMRKKLLLYLWRKRISRYELKPSSARVILFVAEDARPGVVERTLGWHNYVHDLDVIKLRGNHWTMLHLDELRDSDARIFSALQAARANL